jgi:hypothetical protein
MAEMGKYCKAYQAKDLRAFAQWREDLAAMRQDVAGAAEGGRTALRDDDILYLQENYVVTDGIFKDEHIVFADLSEAWKAFCRGQLQFQVPDWDAARPITIDAESRNASTQQPV